MISAHDVTQVIKNMSYLPTDVIKRKKPEVEVTYTCVDGKCDFTAAEEVWRTSTEIAAFDCHVASGKLIECLKMAPDEFLPDKNDGFQLVRNNMVVLRLMREKNAGEDKKGMIGTVDYYAFHTFNRDSIFLATRTPACIIM